MTKTAGRVYFCGGYIFQWWTANMADTVDCSYHTKQTKRAEVSEDTIG